MEKTKTIKDYMVKDVLCVEGDMPLSEAIAKMRVNGMSSLLVKDGKSIAGIFTERDFLNRLNFGDYSRMDDILVKDIMTPGIKAVRSDETYNNTVDMMNKYQIRHMPVIENNRVIGIVSIRELLKSYSENYEIMLEETVSSLASAVEKRDNYTAGHMQRVAKLSCAIAKGMDMPEKDISGLNMAAIIHDVGKMYVPAEFLTKPGILSDAEMTLMKTHTQVGYDIIKGIDFPWPVAKIILQHHERLDGSGYPDGVNGENILPEAKIVGVADTVEAMASHRPYRPALGIDIALETIAEGKNSIYDPDVVDTCINIFRRNRFSFEEKV